MHNINFKELSKHKVLAYNIKDVTEINVYVDLTTVTFKRVTTKPHVLKHEDWNDILKKGYY